jgi:hypothetical protein
MTTRPYYQTHEAIRDRIRLAVSQAELDADATPFHKRKATDQFSIAHYGTLTRGQMRMWKTDELVDMVYDAYVSSWHQVDATDPDGDLEDAQDVCYGCAAWNRAGITPRCEVDRDPAECQSAYYREVDMQVDRMRDEAVGIHD